MAERNYWAVGAIYDEIDKVDEFVNENKWFGWLGKKNEYKSIYPQVKLGDFFLMKSRATKGKKHSISFTKLKKIGVVVGLSNNNTISPVEFKITWLNIEELPKDFDNIFYADTIELMREDVMLDFAKKIIERIEKEQKMEDLKKLLEASKNLILTGAPGTGKTYKAKEIAMQMIFGFVKEEKDLNYEEKKQFEEQCKFVQFHPSYDYTDFVEGLRPKKDNGNENIGFELKDGVFKEFCKDALKNWNNSQKTKEELQKEQNIEYHIDEFLDNAIDNLEELETISKKSKFYILSFEDKNINIKIKADQLRDEVSFSVHLLKNALIDGKEFKTLKDFNKEYGLIHDQKNSYLFAVYKKIKEKMQSPKDKNEDIKIDKKDFIFIIDEINRGEISKIFGELFFSIDPSYRGEKGKVQTQYQNMIKEGDEFKNGFYVPENVYIIGTMNDIDRSVESFDFAMRRRFTWEEITAEQSAENMKLSDDTKNRMKNLNNAISEIDGLSSSYHIGGAYFLDRNGVPIDLKDEAKRNNLWKLRLKSLLFEYLRGMPEADNLLKNLKEIYYSTEELNSEEIKKILEKNENNGQQ